MAEAFLLPAFANATTSFATFVHCRAMGASCEELRAMRTDQRVLGVARAFLRAHYGGAPPRRPDAVQMFLSAYLAVAAENVQDHLASRDDAMRAAGEAGRRLALAGVALLGEVQRVCEAAARAPAVKRKAAARAPRARAAALGALRARLAKAQGDLDAAARGVAALPEGAQPETAPGTAPGTAPETAPETAPAGFRALLEAYTAAMAVGRAAEIAVHERRGAVINNLRVLEERMQRNTDPANEQQMQGLRDRQRRLAVFETVHAQWARMLGLAPAQ